MHQGGLAVANSGALVKLGGRDPPVPKGKSATARRFGGCSTCLVECPTKKGGIDGQVLQ